MYKLIIIKAVIFCKKNQVYMVTVPFYPPLKNSSLNHFLSYNI